MKDKSQFKYKAFISYSHAADGKLAPALQSALHRFAKPWWKLRAMRVFRDQTNLALNPHLWSSIEQALNESEYFVLLASPEAAQSKWVAKEVAHWLSKRPPETLLIVLTDGDIVWDSTAGDFDWTKATALPSALGKVFTEEPLYLDFRSARTQTDLSLHNPEFLNKIARIASPLHGRSLDELIGDDIREHKKTKRLAWSAVIGLIMLTISAVVGGLVAWHQRNQAVSRELAADANSLLNTDAELSVLLSVEAIKVTHTQQAEASLRESLFKSRIREELRKVARAAFDSDPRLLARALDGKSVSPDGTLEATTISAGLSNDAVRITKAKTGQTIAELVGHRSSVVLIAWSPDGRLVITGGNDNAASVWKTGEWRKLADFPMHRGAVDILAFSPDRELVATGSGREYHGTPADRSVWVWDMRTGNPVAKLGGHKSELIGIAFSPDGQFVITEDAFTTRVWNTHTGELVAEWDGKKTTVWDLEYDTGVVEIMGGHPDETGEGEVGIMDLAFSPDGKHLLTVDRNGIGKIWSVASARELHVLPYFADFSSRDEEFGFSFSPDGKNVLSRKGNEIHTWDVASGNKLSTRRETVPVTPQKSPEPLDSGEFEVQSPDGRFVIVRLRDGGAQLLEKTSRTVVTTLPDFSAPLTCVAFSPDGELIAIGSEEKPEAQLYRWETLAPFEDLLPLASPRVSRQLTPQEQKKYLPETMSNRIEDFLVSVQHKAAALLGKGKL